MDTPLYTTHLCDWAGAYMQLLFINRGEAFLESEAELFRFQKVGMDAVVVSSQSKLTIIFLDGDLT